MACILLAPVGAQQEQLSVADAETTLLLRKYLNLYFVSV
jgi:hypothetical protein